MFFLQGTLAGLGGLVSLNRSEIRLKRLTYKQGYVHLVTLIMSPTERKET